jgi:hypothetical protein
MFYSKEILPRWGIMAVDHKTLDAAIQSAKRESLTGDNSGVQVLDCTASPKGALIGIARKGIFTYENP